MRNFDFFFHRLHTHVAHIVKRNIACAQLVKVIDHKRLATTLDTLNQWRRVVIDYEKLNEQI